MSTDPGDGARPLPSGHAALLRCISIAILAWGSIWIFLFQHATELQRDLLFHPVLATSALVAVAVAGHRPRLEPWTYWFGAVLAYTILGSASNPSFFASWERLHALLVSVAFGIPILLALRQTEIGPRILCGACIVLSLAGVLDNVGVDLRAGIANLVNTELVSEEVRIEIVTDRSNVYYWRSQRSHEVWILCLAWIALAALRPATRRDWLVAAAVLAVTGLAVATGYSFATRLIFIAGVGVFCAAFSAPRITLGLSLAAVLVFFLGAPVWANALWSWYVSSPEVFDGTSRLIFRIANWEYWAELIERRPWTGLGLGAYWNLPFTPLADVFGARPAAVLHPQMEYANLPHNLPLQVWGDLGAFGVLLVTGLVASLFVNTVPAHMPGRDAGAAARLTLLATILLVYSVDRAIWTEQNVFQLFLAAGLAAGTLTARAREAPAVTLPGLSPRGEKLLIGAVLLIGSVVAVGNSARIHLADSRYAPERTVLDLERGVLRDGAEEIPLDGQAVGFIDWFGYVDRGARDSQDAMRVSGWAYDPAATGEALQVLVFDGSELLGVTRTGRARPDLQRTSSLPNVDLLFTGFELRLPRPPEWWPPKTEVNAVYLGPSGSASLARVTDSARRRMEAVPAGASGFYVYVDETRNAMVYARDGCGEDDTAPYFFLHVVPVDKDDLPDSRRKYSFDNLDFYFRDYGFRKDGRCFAMMPLPDYDVAEIRTGQSRGQGESWEEHFTFDR